LNEANLVGAYLKNAKLSGTDLTGAKLNRANLNRANMTRTNLKQANLNHARLNDANLSAGSSGTASSAIRSADSSAGAFEGSSCRHVEAAAPPNIRVPGLHKLLTLLCRVLDKPHPLQAALGSGKTGPLTGRVT
jgi:hypothetical protein